MSAAHFYSNYPGSDLAHEAAKLVLARVPANQLPDAVVLVPTRRAATSMRMAFRALAGDATLLLPRLISLADVGEELLSLLGRDAMPILQSIPPAMSKAQRHYLLAAQVMQFEKLRGGDARVEHATKLAQYLADLQDRAIRAGVDLGGERLKELFPRDYATHWQESLMFLNIVGAQWPAIEEAYRQTSAAAHEVAVLAALAQAWRNAPPTYPVFAVGSTASQPATAQLLSTIAQMEQGVVILPGLDPRIAPAAWESVHESHPYFHLKHLLDSNGVQPADVTALGEAPKHCSLWLEALCRVEAMAQWRTAPIDAARLSGVKIIACQHSEEEARVITLLMREGLEDAGKTIALITPDESLMDRVAAQLAHYGITANRTAQGTLAQTQAGSLLVALLEAVGAPESSRALVQLLRHPLVQLGEADAWGGWLDAFERSARGVTRHEIGQLPDTPSVLRDTRSYREAQAIARGLGELARSRLSAAAWIDKLETLLEKLAPQTGQGQEKLVEVLQQCALADLLGPLDIHAMSGLLRDALDTDWRGPQFNAHPQITMLTPVEARLQRFDRVILGAMVERLWPGAYGQSPWLNLAQQAELGLPGIAQHSTLIAHDVLMHGSCGEVFLTYPQREGGSPAARSRYVERLLALAAARDISAEMLEANHYRTLAEQRFDAAFTPAREPYPALAHRPARLSVSQLDAAISDPFALYARAILGLRPLDELDAELEPSDFGTVAHAALATLSRYWSEQGHGPDTGTLHTMATDALRAFENRPAVQLFWQRRLLQALQFVNAKEAARRGTVKSEFEVEQPINTPHGAVTLQGRIDRLEGGVVVDYKTGAPPTARDITNGKAMQLLAYAALLAEQGQSVEAVEYWGLPSGRRDGVVERLAWTPEVAAELSAQFHALLVQIMDPATPFLARPVAGNERFANDYDGISRYDEWAG